jgi:hypothetical protein
MIFNRIKKLGVYINTSKHDEWNIRQPRYDKDR